MSKAASRARLQSCLEQAGSGWIFRYWGNEADKHLDKIAAGLDQFAREYHRRFGDKPDPLLLLEENPLKGAAFFQIDTLLASLEMKVMVWRILLGCEIAKVDVRYRAGDEFRMSLTLRTPYGEEAESYSSSHATDFRILRHLGLTGVGDQVYLQGYYAAKGL